MSLLLYTFVAAITLAVIAFAIFKFKSRRVTNGKVPKKMKAVMLTNFVEKHSKNVEDYDNCFEVQEIDVPKLKPGYVLVKVHESPINPSDLSTMTGTYNSAQREELPSQLGYEGSGEVVASGGGFMGGYLYGKRVGFCSTKGGVGYADYALVNAMRAIPLPSDVTYKEGSSCFVNPLTAISFLEIIQNGKHKAVIHTAACSALGKMFFRLCKANGVELIGIVRREQQVQILKDIGATYVVNSSEENWTEQLAEYSKLLDCRIGFDAVAGELSGQIIKAMPNSSTLYVYGGLSNQHCSAVRPTDLIFQKKTLKGFWLTDYSNKKNLLQMFLWVRKVQKNLKLNLNTEIRKSYSLDEMAEALVDYNSNMSDGKISMSAILN
eukprot:TRINITY_DN3305_c0_g1_i1.p1 TRINITY_DN3305_c0_g1~~TRINITY_DN3305_c0_g1_i1.p1  ORF type:complete len:379 (-),score=124.35 TRINITY_DN3305_c0_g1_i1:203-1339(-)